MTRINEHCVVEAYACEQATKQRPRTGCRVWLPGRRAALAAAVVQMAVLGCLPVTEVKPVSADIIDTSLAEEATHALSVEQVRHRFERGGFDVATPDYWSSSNLHTFFAWDAERLILVLVYPDVEWAIEEWGSEHALEEREVGLMLPISEDRGPQLIAGYGRSAWWRNIGVVQAINRHVGSSEGAEPISTARSRRAGLAALNLVDGDIVRVLRGN
jgi:hypothetical protein